MSQPVGPAFDAFFHQLQVAERAAAHPLASDRDFLMAFEYARRVLHDYFDARTIDDDIEAQWLAATQVLVDLGRSTAPVLADLQGGYFRTQLLAWVVYRVLHDLGEPEMADQLYGQYAPRVVAQRPDLRALRKALDLRHPLGRPAGEFAIADPDELKRRLRAAADELARQQQLITAGALARAIGVDEKRLRTWARQLGLGALKSVVRTERARHQQKLRRARA